MKPFPVQYSTLSSTALNSRIRQAYEITDSETKFLLRGVSDTYLINCPETKYIFKVYRSRHRSLEEIRGEVELLNILKNNKAKVSTPVADVDGNYVQQFYTGEGFRYGVLFTYAEGKSVNNLSEEQLEIVGREMALNHNITSTLELNYSRPEYNLQSTIHKPMQDLKPAFEEHDYSEGYEYLKSISKKSVQVFETFKTQKFGYGYCHYDYLPKNFHFDDQGLFTLFDFDFAGNGYLVNDLMTFQVHYFFQILYGGMTDMASRDAMNIFINAYRAEREISESELQAIPCLGIMFWIFYLSVQYKGFDDFSNNYFNRLYLKKWIGWIEEWENLYCDF